MDSSSSSSDRLSVSASLRLMFLPEDGLRLGRAIGKLLSDYDLFRSLLESRMFVVWRLLAPLPLRFCNSSATISSISTTSVPSRLCPGTKLYSRLTARCISSLSY